jgi:hypothetical protein
MLKKLIYGLHRILGTLLGILFLVWFLSGFVMIFHRFPKVPAAGKYVCMDTITGDMPDMDTVLEGFSPVRSDTVRNVSLKTLGGNVYFELTTEDSTYKKPVDSVKQAVDQPGYKYIEAYAKRWVNAEIARVDTLYELEQWIPFGRLRNEFPIYKFYFEDRDKHQLYVSSVTGEALQFTDKNSRFWAWLGAIPHWVYFTSLRQHSQLWQDVVIWLSGIGCIVCVAGIIIGIRSYLNVYRKKRKWKTPYKKPAYKWHHILGFVFGVFVFTFVFSGMMSLATIPGWMVKVHHPELQRAALMPEPVIFRNYKLDYRQILQAYPRRVKSIEWASFGETPLYKAIIGDSMYVFNAENRELTKLYVNEAMIKSKLSALHTEPVTIRLMHAYDHYYIDRERTLPLPVYKVDVADADHSTYYIHPESGSMRYFNTNTKIRRWTYQMLHRFECRFLVKHPILWNMVMWITMVGGTLVSATGVWLGIRYIRRKMKT